MGSLLRRLRNASLVLILGVAAVPFADAASLTVEINYPGMTPHFLDSAFVYLVPDSPVKARGKQNTSQLTQKGKLFHPYTQAIRVGDALRFPNHDTVSHHVYSFSPPKVFELPLYSAERNPPQVVFDRPGLVVLGCNIHDWMLAFVLVVDTPWYEPVQDNRVVFADLPDGHYSLFFWYPSTDTGTQVMRTLDLTGATDIAIDLLDRPALLEQPSAPPRRPGRREEY